MSIEAVNLKKESSMAQTVTLICSKNSNRSSIHIFGGKLMGGCQVNIKINRKTSKKLPRYRNGCIYLLKYIICVAVVENPGSTVYDNLRIQTLVFENKNFLMKRMTRCRAQCSVLSRPAKNTHHTLTRTDVTGYEIPGHYSC